MVIILVVVAAFLLLSPQGDGPTPRQQDAAGQFQTFGADAIHAVTAGVGSFLDGRDNNAASGSFGSDYVPPGPPSPLYRGWASMLANRTPSAPPGAPPAAPPDVPIRPSTGPTFQARSGRGAF